MNQNPLQAIHRGAGPDEAPGRVRPPPAGDRQGAQPAVSLPRRPWQHSQELPRVAPATHNTPHKEQTS